MEKCAWCRDGGLNERYHDTEWGVPLWDDQKQFEFLMLEVMQCGLSWTLMLKKRETFRALFANFDYEAVARFTNSSRSEGSSGAFQTIFGVSQRARPISIHATKQNGFHATIFRTWWPPISSEGGSSTSVPSPCIRTFKPRASSAITRRIARATISSRKTFPSKSLRASYNI